MCQTQPQFIDRYDILEYKILYVFSFTQLVNLIQVNIIMRFYLAVARYPSQSWYFHLNC